MLLTGFEMKFLPSAITFSKVVPNDLFKAILTRTHIKLNLITSHDCGMKQYIKQTPSIPVGSYSPQITMRYDKMGQNSIL